MNNNQTKKRLTRAERNKVELPNYTEERLIGHLLGDGYLVKSEGVKTNARFGLRQSSKKKEYFEKVFSNFQSVCSEDYKPLVKQFTTNKTNLESLSFLTLRLPCFNPYYEMFYASKIDERQVPDNIYELLTPVGLAY